MQKPPEIDFTKASLTPRDVELVTLQREGIVTQIWGNEITACDRPASVNTKLLKKYEFSGEFQDFFGMLFFENVKKRRSFLIMWSELIIVTLEDVLTWFEDLPPHFWRQTTEKHEINQNNVPEAHVQTAAMFKTQNLEK